MSPSVKILVEAREKVQEELRTLRRQRTGREWSGTNWHKEHYAAMTALGNAIDYVLYPQWLSRRADRWSSLNDWWEGRR